MKKFSLTLFIFSISITMAFSQTQTQKEEIEHRHSIGAPLWMISNFFEEPAEYYLLTYGYQLTQARETINNIYYYCQFKYPTLKSPIIKGVHQSTSAFGLSLPECIVRCSVKINRF